MNFSLNNKILKSAIVVSLLFTMLTGNAQDRRENFNFWMLGAGGGATLFFGDMSNDVDNPFSKYFTVQQGWAGSLSLHKRVLPYLAFNVQGTYGNWQGQRTQWSNGTPVFLAFDSKMTEFQLNAELNLLNLINPKPRFINFYVKAGGAYTFYNASKTDFRDDSELNSAKGGVFAIPWGFGGRLDFNERWGFYGETMFNHAFGDDLDAHASTWTDVNDIYTFTSFGITYKMFPKDKTPKIEEVEIVPPVDSVVAQIDYDPINVKVNSPRVVEPGAEFSIRIQIDKDTRKESAKLQQTLPLGFTATEKESEGGEFTFVDQLSNISWDELPETPKTLFLEYKIKVAETVDEKEYIIPGILFFSENGEEQIQQFKLSLKVERPVIAEETEPNTQTDTQPVNDNTLPASSDNGIVFRVQVKAIYGGKSSPDIIKKKYGIDGEVYEDYHNGYMKYTTGSFNNYQEAAQLKQTLREQNVPGAFIVAYKDGKRMNDIQEALNQSETGNQKQSHPKASSSSSNSKGTSYRIQIAASSRDFSTDHIRESLKLTQEVSKEKHNGLNKYTVGEYNNFNDAKSELDKIKNTVSDAFIVKYLNGKR